MSEMLEAALGYARRGWPVFPCAPREKKPLTPHGCRDATVDPEQIRAWWQRWPDANIGLATGGCGLVAIDIDPGKGGTDTWAELRRRLDIDDGTVTAVTGGGGKHLLYRAPEGIRIPNSVGKLGAGVDVRGDGGYIVVPPSVHPNGTPYRWETGYSPDDRGPLPLPQPLLRLLADGHEIRSFRERDEGSRIPEGKRNATLTSLAGAMRRRGMTPEAIEAALVVENARRCDPPLDTREVRRIAASVGRYEPAIAGAPQPGTLGKDYGHALTLSHLFRGRYRWAVHRGSWMEYAGGVWRPVPEEAVARVASEVLRAVYSRALADATDKETINDLIQAVKDTCYYARMVRGLAFLKGWGGFLTRSHEWDADPWLLNVANGTIDLRTLELRTHNPDDLLTKQAPVVYDPHARGAAWEAHLARFLPNPHIRRQVQRDLGRALVGAPLDETFPIWWGTGANGKSTTVRVLLGVLGDYGCRAAPNLLTQSSFETHPTNIADLAGRRLVFSVEVDEGKRLAEALVKDLTGGDRKKARFMRQDYFEFEQTFSMVLIVNHRPVIQGTDDSIWRRVRLIPWEYRIPDDERRPQEEVVRELVAEGSAVLNWLIEGLADWLRDRNWLAPEVIAATEAYRLDQDVLGSFLGERCELGARYSVGVGDLYTAYTGWCEEAGEEPVSKTKFGSLLRQRGVGQTREALGKRKWVGLRLRRDGDKV